MRKYLCMIIMVCALCLTGCGKEEVAYDAKEITDAERNGGQEIQEKDNETDLKQVLGIEETQWKEDVASDTGTVYISADIEVPETTVMYTQEVSEHYLTQAEQEEIARYFMDTYDVDNGAESKEPGRTNYTGSKGEIEYTLCFDMDEESNTSAWELEAVDGNDFSTAKISETEKVWKEAGGYPNENSDNLCGMTKEQAGRKAQEICEQLGILNMKPVAVMDLVIWLNEFQDSAAKEAAKSEYGIPHEKNGYSVVLLRDVNGVAVDGGNYSLGRYDNGTAESPYRTREGKLFDKEKIRIEFNDKGLISMTCTGIMTAKEIGNEVKLLSYDQIKEMFRKELKGLPLEEKYFKYLYLMYERVVNEENPDEYCYIPVWFLCSKDLHKYGDTNGINSGAYADEMVWINAIDGTRIDPEESGIIEQ